MPRGGRRPGAGAPKGNYNAFKHGKRSRRLRELSAILALVPRTRRRVDGDPNESRLAAALLLSAFMDRLSLHSRKLADPGFQDLYRAVKALQPPEAKRPTKKTAVKNFPTNNQKSCLSPTNNQKPRRNPALELYLYLTFPRCADRLTPIQMHGLLHPPFVTPRPTLTTLR